MSDIAQWLADLQQLDIHVSPFRLDHDSLDLNAKTLSSALADTGAVDGWLMEAGGVQTLRQQTPAFDTLPLAGEWCRDEQHWVLVHEHGMQWRLHHYRLQSVDDANQASHLGMRRRHRGINGDALLHCCLWAADDSGAPHLQLSLFTGFEGQS